MLSIYMSLYVPPNRFASGLNRSGAVSLVTPLLIFCPNGTIE